jgi:DNA-binding HxlR family transcriptional regulator
MRSGVYRYILNKTNSRILIEMLYGPMQSKKLSQTIGITYWHTTNILRELVIEGLVKREIKNNIHTLTLTKKGVQVANCIRDIIAALEKKEETDNGTE